MIKKITAMVLSFAMLFSTASFAATFTDVVVDGSEASNAVSVLSELGVISGMGDGTFSPYSSLTRAQMAKIAVCIMGKTQEAVVTTDAFSDVKSTDWYSGYVNAVAKDGIITGYPDGRFGAEDKLTFAQAITIVVRLLGYDASDVGYKWPQGYIEKAEVLSLTEGMSFSANDEISRIHATLLIYRALFTDMKGTKNALVTKMDKNVYEDTVILATNNENASLLVNEVQTDKAKFTFDEAVCDMAGAVGKEGTLVVNDENKVIAFVEDDNFESESYTVSAVYRESNSDYASLITQEGKTVLVSTKAKVYLGGAEYTGEKLTEGLNSGSNVTLFKEDGSLKYVFVEEYKNQGPVTVIDTNTVKDIFNVTDADSAKVVRKGVAATWDDIEMYDVLYYSEKTNTIYAYCDRVTGMYEEAYPMKTNVTRVTVSGTEYNLSSMTAVNKLNESKGAFAIGDRVTLLFGEDGGVVDAVSLTYADYSMYGVVTGSGSELSEDEKGRSQYYVNVMHTDGETVKYIVKDDSYEEEAGKLCIVDFEDSYAVLEFVSASYITGYVNKNAGTIGSKKLANDVKILECTDESKIKATVSTVKISDIDSVTLAKKDVKNVVYNKRGEIAVLYLDNVTGNSSIYGIVIDDPGSYSKDGDKVEVKSGTYTVLNNNTKYTYNGTHTSIRKGDCVEYKKGESGTEIKALVQIAAGSVIDDCTDNVISVNGNQYILADNATVYAGDSVSDLKSVSWEDAVGLEGRVTLFSEKSTSSGGKIRVVRIYTAQ